jgi:hypothetical protein
MGGDLLDLGLWEEGLDAVHLGMGGHKKGDLLKLVKVINILLGPAGLGLGQLSCRVQSGVGP